MIIKSNGGILLLRSQETLMLPVELSVKSTSPSHIMFSFSSLPVA